ncbi:MAG: hypothetical protein IJ080_03235 [Oscillospiraceae bacterium]|nr:hypothetical protein [Oscillospiraceae bacterium]
MSTAVLAADEGNEIKEKPTFAFDTNDSMSYFHKFGNASDTNLTLELTDAGAYEGRSLKFSESFTGSISNQYGGIYFDSADFGLSNFAGYTLEVKIKASKAASKATPNITLFGDGQQWVAQNVAITESDRWLTGSVSIPAGVADSKLGISIPITEAFEGEVISIDNLVIKDNYGKQIENVGDIDTSIAQKSGTFSRVMGIVLFVLVAAAAIGGIVFFVLKIMRRYR